MKKRYLTIMTIITSISLLLSSDALFGGPVTKKIMMYYAKLKMKRMMNEQHLIGGADGPTSIFLATTISKPATLWIIGFNIALCSITAACFFIYFRVATKKEK